MKGNEEESWGLSYQWPWAGGPAVILGVRLLHKGWAGEPHQAKAHHHGPVPADVHALQETFQDPRLGRASNVLPKQPYMIKPVTKSPSTIRSLLYMSCTAC